MCYISNDWKVIRPEDNNDRVIMIYSDGCDYIVDVKHEGQLDIDIRMNRSATNCLAKFNFNTHNEYVPESRHITILHKINIDDFIPELIHLLMYGTYLTPTNYDLGLNKDGNRYKIHRNPIRDIYEAIQDLVIKY